jgi:midasin (ATPase involved in ribosome maturation)
VLPVQQAAPTNSASEGLGCFTPTGLALRLMERIGVCLSRAEPVLLVGETGTGKTTTLTQVMMRGAGGGDLGGGGVGGDCCQVTLVVLS